MGISADGGALCLGAWISFPQSGCRSGMMGIFGTMVASSEEQKVYTDVPDALDFDGFLRAALEMPELCTPSRLSLGTWP